jgi:uncharacterized protein YciI
MYIIDILIKTEKLSDQQLKMLLEKHQAWFEKYFEQGSFLLVGPYLNRGASGMILAQTESRASLDKILAEDAFYADDLATYIVHEFKAAKIAANIGEYQGK